MTYVEFLQQLRQSKQSWHLIPCSGRFPLRTYNRQRLCPIQAVAADQQNGTICSVYESAKIIRLRVSSTDKIIIGADDELRLKIVREDLLRSTGFRPIAHLS